MLHITDGASTDGDPQALSDAIRQISTNDGSCLLFNLHVSSAPGEALRFPSNLNNVSDPYARQLFCMSSVLPSHISKLCQEKGYAIEDGARGFMFNTDPKDIVNFFDIGTRPRLSADR